MKAALLIVPLLLIGSVSGEEKPVSMIRSAITTTGTIWTGQRVELGIDLVAPGYFSGNAVFDLPSLPDALIVPPAGSPIVGSESIGGKDYVTQRHTVTIYPRRPGVLEIPAFNIRFSIKPDPLAHDPIEQSVKTTALRLDTKQPPGLPADGMTITSADLTVEESWQPVPGHDAKPGDAFVRTVKWHASDMTGIAFPPFPDQSSGPIALYRSSPEVQDETSRDGTSGNRSDKLTYVSKAGGSASIPAITFRWWDPAANEIKQVVLPGHDIHIIAPPVPPEPPLRRMWNFIRHHAIPITTGIALTLTLATAGYLSRRSIIVFLRLLKPNHLPPLNPSGPP